MSLPFVEGSLTRIDDKTLSFKLVNYVGTGSATVRIRVLMDGEDVTSKTKVRIGSEERSITQPMVVYSSYGENIEFIISSDKPIPAGKHKFRVEISVESPIWTTITTEFEGEA